MSTFLTASVVIIVVFFVLWAILRSGERMLAEERRRGANASPADATILAVGRSQTQRGSGTVLVKLHLEIVPRDASQKSFQASTVWEIEPAALVRIETGAKLSIKYDEIEEARIYPLDAWAKFNPLKNRIWNEKL